jgi:hypothetical protein
MALRTPQLDDRTFDQLLDMAKQRARQVCPDWDLTPSDPGAVLLDVFTYLTEVLTYRLNRIPEKAYIEFLNLLGVKIQPPVAAAARLVFTRARASEVAAEIRKGTRVTVARPAGSGESPVFTTAESIRIEPGQTEASTMAYQAELIEGELLGYGTGQPGLSLATRRAPILASNNGAVQFVVGVETDPERLQSRTPAIQWNGKVYRIWNEVEHFANLQPEMRVYVVDRTSGLITFAPSLRRVSKDGLSNLPEALAAVPRAGREIRAWYWRGGGTSGNVGARLLKVLKDAIPGVTVLNPEAAAGGRDAETLENAMKRGPAEFRSLERAVTASDFEKYAQENGPIARAKAIARAEVWAHAVPGTVEVLLVPQIPAEALAGPLDAKALTEYQSSHVREQIHADLDQRRPIGTKLAVSWAHAKTACVKARVVAYREEDRELLQARLLERIFRRINPAAWPFGETLRESHIYDLILSEPGVNHVDEVGFEVAESPNMDVRCLVRDRLQKNTWYAAAGDALYRSTNNGDGWERCASFSGQRVAVVANHPDKAGLLAVMTGHSELGQQSAVYISEDAGETWDDAMPTGFRIEDAAWTLRDGVPVLFLATHVGLYEVVMSETRNAIQILVDAEKPNRGFNAMAVLTDVRGSVSVALASQESDGVYLSSDGGRPGTFRNIGLKGVDIATLAVQHDGPRMFLWAGIAETASEGQGAARIELVGADLSADSWNRHSEGWRGGSCSRLAFDRMNVYAASYQSGVLSLDSSASPPKWQAPPIDCGLPQRGTDRIFQSVTSVAASNTDGMILCGGAAGIFRSVDSGKRFQNISSPVMREVTIPDTWLFCSGAHQVEVLERHETR